MGYTVKSNSAGPKSDAVEAPTGSLIEKGSPKVDPKPYLDQSTDLALTPPQRDWSKEALDNRLQRHADAIEKATASARADDSDGPTTNDAYPTKTDLSKYGF